MEVSGICQQRGSFGFIIFGSRSFGGKALLRRLFLPFHRSLKILISIPAKSKQDDCVRWTCFSFMEMILRSEHFSSKLSSCAYLAFVVFVVQRKKTKIWRWASSFFVRSFRCSNKWNGRLEHLFRPRLNHLLTQLTRARASAHTATQTLIRRYLCLAALARSLS